MDFLLLSKRGLNEEALGNSILAHNMIGKALSSFFDGYPRWPSQHLLAIST
jgi:hypothetical protein